MNVKTVELRHEGGLRFVARTGSGHEVVIDDGEGDAGARPTELLAAALAACTAMDVASIALKKRQELAGYRVHVRAMQRDEHPQVFNDIDLLHEVEGRAIDTAAIRRCIELSAEKYCPISAMLSAGETVVHHRYRILRPDAEPEEGEVVVTGPYRRTGILAT